MSMMSLKKLFIIACLIAVVITVGTVTATNTTPYNGNIVFLAHGNVSPFVDEQGHSITNTNSVALDTVIKALGAGSARFLGTSSQDLHTSALNSTGLPGDYTVMFWANVSSSDGTYDAMIADGAYPSAAATVIFVDNTGKVQVYSNSASKITSTTVIGSTNTWHQIVLNRSSGVSKLFIDGNKEGSDWSNTLNVFSSNLYLGWESSVGTTHLTGNLDEVVVWNRSIPIEDIWPLPYEVKTNDTYPPVSSFSSRNISIATNTTSEGWAGQSPFTMQFNDTSTNNPTSGNYSYQGYGTNTTSGVFANTLNATATFTAGNFTISHGVANADGSSFSTQTTWINVSSSVEVPIVQWITDKLTVVFPGRIMMNETFIRDGIHDPTAWNYTTGDGKTNVSLNERNVSYQYVKRGIWNASLTVSNSAGANTSYKLIRVIGYASLTPTKSDKCMYSSSRDLDILEKARVECQLCGIC